MYAHLRKNEDKQGQSVKNDFMLLTLSASYVTSDGRETISKQINQHRAPIWCALSLVKSLHMAKGSFLD